MPVKSTRQPGNPNNFGEIIGLNKNEKEIIKKDLDLNDENLNVKGKLKVNSFSDIEETTADGTKTLQTSLDEKQDKLASDGLQTATLDKAIGFDANGELVKGQLDSEGGTSVEALTYDKSYSPLSSISINKNNYRLLPLGAVYDKFSIAIGGDSNAKDSSVAIGEYAEAGTHSISIGYDATNSEYASQDAVSIGMWSKAGYSSVAIGYDANAYQTKDAIAIGAGAIARVNGWVSFDGSNSSKTISVKNTDKIFFRNENISKSKTTTASYTNGKTLTQYLNEAKEGVKYFQHTILISRSDLHNLCFTVTMKNNTQIETFDALYTALNGTSATAWGYDGTISYNRITIGTNADDSYVMNVNGVDTKLSDSGFTNSIVDKVSSI